MQSLVKNGDGKIQVNTPELKNPIIVALDVDDSKIAYELYTKLSPYVGGFKIGPRLTFKCEKSFLKNLSQSGILFFDHKFFDIPSTTCASVQIAADMGADWVTVHALNGPETLNDLAKLEKKMKSANENFRILAVTVLTSFSPRTLPPIWKDINIEQSVEILAQSVLDSGLTSLVCSASELKKLRMQSQKSFLVVPGIRPVGSSLDDQARIATPRQAIDQGASALVIGRPILQAADPVLFTKKILETLK